MPPSGLAILIGAGPNTGTGIARILSSPSSSNLAIALIARTSENLTSVKNTILASNPSSTIECFPSDTSPAQLDKAFHAIANHGSFSGLKLRAAIYSVKHAAKKPFLEETHEAYVKAQEEYQGGAVHFAQLAIRRFFKDNGGEGKIEKLGPSASSVPEGKKGTLIFTGTLGALRTNAQFASYGASRAGVRMLAQGLAKEFSEKGVHVAHVIANGRIVDDGGKSEATEVQEGRWMSADDVGREYAHLIAQRTVWTHELDMRPPQEKF